MVFDKFSFASAAFCNRESLAMYGAGVTTGVVVRIGHNTSHVVPVYEGYSLPVCLAQGLTG
jgi:actin-related protein